MDNNNIIITFVNILCVYIRFETDKVVFFNDHFLIKK